MTAAAFAGAARGLAKGSVRAAGGPRARWTTPRLLRLFFAAVMVLAALVALVGWRAVARAREAIETVGRETAPAIIAAQEVFAALADLDASEANYLLVSDPMLRDQAAQLFEFRRAEITKRLVDAARGAALSETARASIVLIFENLGRYAEVSSRARESAERGDPSSALDAYRVATDIMHARILVDAQRLDDENKGTMEAQYGRQQSASLAMETLALVSGSLLVAALVAGQLYLLRRTRRVVSVPLLVATIVAAAYTADLQRRIGDAREDLRVAKVDAFESIHALWQARAKAYDANGDESRRLLDPAHADSWGARFATNVGTLTTAPTMPDSVRQSVAFGGKVDFGGLFANELNNTTFVGEREAATAMVEAFSAYYAFDAQLRDLEHQGKHADAIVLRLGPAQRAFATFDSTALRTIRLNQNVFDAVVSEAEGALASAAWLGPLLAIFIALAAWLGVRPRLREYAS